MKKGAWILLVVLLVLAVACLIVVRIYRQSNYILPIEERAEEQTLEEQINGEEEAVEFNEVLIRNFVFIPQTISVPAGTTVRWINDDVDLHTIDSDILGSPILSRGDSFEYTFSEIGSYNYICGLHPQMTGTVIVE